MGFDGDLDLRHLDAAASWSLAILRLVPSADWSALSLTRWTVRETVDHTIDALLFYIAHVGVRARTRLYPLRNGDPAADTTQLLEGVSTASKTLGRLLAAMNDDERAYHPSGMADRAGFIGMACTELLAHTYDIAAGRISFSGPDEKLCDAVLNRIFPWAPTGRPRETHGSWRIFLSVTGRVGIGDRPPADADWWYQSAPLTEWDGSPHRRTSPPQWR